MLATVTKEFRFEAAHSLLHLPEGHKCKRLHGHSYRFRVHCRGQVNGGEFVNPKSKVNPGKKGLSQRAEIDPKRGFVIDYAEISAAAKPLIETLDHRNLNDIFAETKGWEDLPTSAEYLALFIYNAISAELGGIVYGITVFETSTTSVEYFPAWNGAATPGL